MGLYQRFGNGTLYDRAEIDAFITRVDIGTTIVWHANGEVCDLLRNFLNDLLSLKDYEGDSAEAFADCWDEFLAARDLARRMDDLIQRQAH